MLSLSFCSCAEAATAGEERRNGVADPTMRDVKNSRLSDDFTWEDAELVIGGLHAEHEAAIDNANRASSEGLIVQGEVVGDARCHQDNCQHGQFLFLIPPR